MTVGVGFVQIFYMEGCEPKSNQNTIMILNKGINNNLFILKSHLSWEKLEPGGIQTHITHISGLECERKQEMWV